MISRGPLPLALPRKVPSGCTLFYEFSIDTGSLISDCSGNGHHGDIQGGLPRAGQTGLVRRFDSIDDCVNTVDEVPLNGSSWTMAIWSDFADLGSTNIQMAYAWGDAPAIDISTDGKVRISANSVIAVTSGAGVIIPGNWSFIVATYDLANGHAVYVNGESVSLTAVDTVTYETSSIGVFLQGGSTGVPVMIGEVFCLDHSMDSKDVVDYYQKSARRYE